MTPSVPVFVSADYAAIDLTCAAQTIYSLFGESELRDQINAGLDPHTVMAVDFAQEDYPWWGDGDYAEFQSLKKEPHLPSCVFDADTSIWDCPSAHDEGGCKPGFREAVRSLAKKIGLGLLGGMGIARLCATVAKELHRKISEDKAARLKKLWANRYPTSARYLKWIGKQKDGASGEWLYYTSPLGMRRARCSYPEAANGKALQTPAAEGMKIAMWLITKECYAEPGTVLYEAQVRPAINIHDELVGKFRWTSAAQGDAVARRWAELMVKGQRVICPDVLVKAEPLLATRWVKKARQVKNRAGLIVPWTYGVDE